MRRRVAVLLIAGLALAPHRVGAQSSAYEQLQAFSSVINYVRANYADSVGYATLVHAAIDGMLSALDPHSYFISRADWEKQNAMERGELATTGLVLEEVDSAVTVLAVRSRSPAEKAGIQPGDRVVAVSDTVVRGTRAYAVELQLAGQKGSRVQVQLERGSRLEPERFSVSLKRDFIKPVYVPRFQMLDSITGYVRLAEFGDEAASEVHKAIGKLKGKGARRLILDLRSNPGGLVQQAVEIASDFFPKGTLLFRTRGRKLDVNLDYVSKHDGSYRDLPLIVLINQRSASASEALTGSLQDHDRALVVGRRSFGKALVQIGFPIAPSGDEVMLTIGRVFTPSGRVIQRRYRGLTEAQYRSFAGVSGAGVDTTEIFHTDHGREVRGGGGIAPDIEVPAAGRFPVWLSVAADSGFDDAVSDSVAQALADSPAALQDWIRSPGRWQTSLLPPFLDRVRNRLHIAARTDSAMDGMIARLLADRVAEVRWPPDGAWIFSLATDPAVKVALDSFPRLDTLLKNRVP